MGIAFDYAPDRPERIDRILNGLDRYNPEKTTVFQDYVTQQCEDRTYDCYANLALLKLWVRSFKVFGRCKNEYDDRSNVSYYLSARPQRALNQPGLRLKLFFISSI